MRDLRLFLLTDNDKESDIVIQAIHDESGYTRVREALSQQYNLGSFDPDIQVFSVDFKGGRALTLHYTQHNRVPLDENTPEVMKHLHTLWKFPVVLKSMSLKGEPLKTYHCPIQETQTDSKENQTDSR